MDEQSKMKGRGSKLLEALKAKSPGETSQSSSEVSPAGAIQKPLGRGHFLEKIRSQAKLSETLGGDTTGSEFESPVTSTPKFGRGSFLAQIAKQSKEKPSTGKEEASVKSSVESFSRSFSKGNVEKSSLQKKFEELSVKGEEGAPNINRGEKGEKIIVSANYISLTTDTGKGVFEYDVTFSPEIHYTTYRYKLIHQYFNSLKGVKCYDGTDRLYVPEKLSQDEFIVKAEHPVDNSLVEIFLVFKRQMKPKECTHLYNILFNNCSKALNLTRLERQYYDYSLSHQIPQHKLEVWPGYVTAVEEFEGGIHLCCDIRHRVLRTETAYDVLASISKIDSSNFKTLATNELLGKCVLTRYNNNLYRIDDIIWDKTPLNTFKTSSGEEITFLEYYKKQYNLNINDVKQPLLINKPKGKKNKETSHRLICLVPELCYMTGLTDQIRKDMKVMKEIAVYTQVTPSQRHLGIKKFIENLKNNSRSKQILQDWGLKLADQPLQLDARVLPRENLYFKNKVRVPAPENVSWSKFIQNYGVLHSVDLQNWIFIYPIKDSNLANTFTSIIQKVGPGLGIEIHDPISVSLRDDKIESYIKALKEKVTPKAQIVVCLCPSAREDRYSAIKKICCREISIPSQIVVCESIARANRMRPVIQNVALQINNKLGGASWSLNIPLRNCMVCGIDSYHDVDKKSNSVGAFVASLNSDYTKWFSKACIQEPKQELLDGLVFCFILALKKYLVVNNSLPERIVIYRDGVGDGQFSVVQNHEIKQFIEACLLVSENYAPKFSFVVIQKRINTKFYKYSDSSGNYFENPGSGAILDHTVTRRNYYDFFLVPQHVTFGTASPSHYVVLYDSSELKPDYMQQLTYKFCHLYYNWCGTIRIPAPCQYAHKLASLVGQNVRGLPNEFLDDKLYYL